jgi:hypothetical protein
MKKSLTLAIALLFLGVCAWGQSFTLSPNPSSIPADPNIADLENHMVITNTDPIAKNMRWTRTEVYLSDPSLQTQVCDNVACYLPSASSKPFPLASRESFDMIVHLLNPNAVQAEAIVHLRIHNEDMVTDSTTAVYVFSMATSTSTPLADAGVRVFPNPTVDQFQLQHADEVASIRIFSMDGRMVMQQNATPDQRYNVADLKPATYIVALENEKGHLFQALELVVR